MVRLGIIGIGNMGSTHARNILAGKCPEITLTCVADVNTERLKWAKENLSPSLVCFSKAEELIGAHLCDAVLIAVPHYFHPVYAIMAMKEGYHVLSEKPAGVDTLHVREMNEAAEKSGRVFGIMFNQRTNHLYRTMHDLVQSGRLGALRRTSWIITDWYRTQAYYDSGAWRATWAGEGGGVLLNQCPHQLDLWQWICGMPVSVRAEMDFGKWHDIEVEDDVSAFVRYENGATGTFITTTGDPCGVNRFEISLSKGKILCENGKLSVWEFECDEKEHSRTEKNPYKALSAHPFAWGSDGKNEQHIGVLNNFAAAILHGEPLIAPGREGIRALTLSNAMHLSAWTGEEVTLPLDENRFLSLLNERIASSRRKDTASVYTDTSDLKKLYHL